MTQKRMQLSVFAVAALAIVAVAAVMLLAGGGSARADTASLAPDGVGVGQLPHDRPSGQAPPPPPPTSEPTPQPTATPTPRTHATPEPCPGETGNPNSAAAPVVDSGHIALFDVWWNPEELELTNSSCPPTVAHDRATGSDTRSPSSINIDETVIHIPNSAKVTLTEADYPKAQYQPLWNADDAENPNGDGDRIMWMLPACPPEGTPPANGLCLSFSAALLNSSDWLGIDADGNGGIVYHVDHVHQVDIDKQENRYVLVYEGVSGGHALRWNSYDASESEMPVAPGGYDRPVWFFTSRGTYEFQVHITGNPEQDTTKLGGLDPVSTNPSVNGDVREYILHVGAEADLGVSVKAAPADKTDTSLDPGDKVTVAITASNAGPDTASGTKVDVSLPEGLTYASHAAETGTTYNSTTGVWTIGDLANGAPESLSITATIAAGTRGQELAVKATISATETVLEEYSVPVLDPNPANDMATATTTVATASNVNPMFGIMRSVNENAPGGTNVGDPIKVIDPDDSADLVFSLDEAGKKHFTVSNVGGNAQIAVKANVYLNYEETNTFQFTLQVSDQKTVSGNTDDETDDSIPVIVSLTDVAETGRLGLVEYGLPWPPVAGQTIQLCTEFEDYPGSADLPFTYLWQVRENSGDVPSTYSSGTSNCRNFHQAEAGTVEFRAIGFTPPNGNPRNAVTTDWWAITWGASSQ